MASIVKRGPGAWQAQVRRRGYPTQSRTLRTKQEAEAWAATVESAMHRGTWICSKDAERTTLYEAIARYLSEVTPTKKGATQEAYRLGQWQSRPISKRFLSTLRGSDMAEYRDWQLKQGYSPTTIKNDLSALSHVFTVARKDWGMESLSNPVANVRMPRMPRGRDRRLLPGEESLLLDNTEYPLRELIILGLDTAMRAGELVSLQWSSVDMESRIFRLLDTKNNESRDVPMSIRVHDTLCSMPRRLDGRLTAVKTSGSLSHRFLLRCRKLGIEDLHFHDLRHEATSRLFERGLGMMEVAAITGHKTLSMLKRYTHLKAVDLVSKIG